MRLWKYVKVEGARLVAVVSDALEGAEPELVDDKGTRACCELGVPVAT